MVVNTAANDHRFDQFQGFSMLHLQALSGFGEASSQSLSNVCRPLSDCTYDMLKPHFPKCEHHHDYEELRDQ
jgi:putative alpha-1,2-mannosidase